MRPVSVHAAVEALIGEKVSKDSVSWVLSSGRSFAAVRSRGERPLRPLDGSVAPRVAKAYSAARLVTNVIGMGPTHSAK